MEGVRLVVELAIISPGNAPITSTTDHSLSNYPASFHRCNLDHIKGLQQGNIIGTISFHEDSITSIHLNCAFLVKEVHWDLFSILGWHQDLVTCEVLSIDPWVSHQLQLLNHMLLPCFVVIFVVLMVNERRLKVEVQLLCVIVLVHSRANRTNIIVDIDCRIDLGVQILDHNLRFAITFAVQSYEVLEGIDFS